LDFSFNFIALTETWFTEASRDLYDLDNYNHESFFRTKRRGGGVSLFVKDNISYTLRSDLNMFNNDAETIFIEVSKNMFNTDRNIIVAVIYRAPNREINSFNETLNNVLNTIKNENKICYLLGDYNINLFNSDSHAHTSDFLDICFSNNFLPLINKPTRITKYSATLIDN
jgi:exonuclease III